ncbi:MAG: hypothetical protein ACTSWZ_01940 [Candidatus Heimdallarchaeaceae archaeon]
MDYKVEPLETNFGKGVRIEKGRRSYEQFSCKNGLFARVYQAPHKEKDQLVDTDYHGVIFRAPFVDNDQDYEQFRVLAERIQQASGEEVPNSKARFMDYISHSGLEQELSRIEANVRINLKNRQDLPDNALSWLNRKSHLAGLVSDVALYLGGFALIVNTVPDAELAKALPIYGIITPIFEGLLGLMGGRMGYAKWGWCGPLHVPAFVPSWFHYKDKLKHPTHILGKFMQNYQRLDAMGSSVGNQNQYAKQSKKADRHFGVLEDMFPFTKHQRGFSITYDSPNRDNVISFFDYVLEGGNVPQLPNPQAKVQKPKTQEKPVEIEPVETNFINPWEVKIPKLGGKKNE